MALSQSRWNLAAMMQSKNWAAVRCGQWSGAIQAQRGKENKLTKRHDEVESTQADEASGLQTTRRRSSCLATMPSWHIDDSLIDQRKYVNRTTRSNGVRCDWSKEVRGAHTSYRSQERTWIVHFAVKMHMKALPTADEYWFCFDIKKKWISYWWPDDLCAYILNQPQNPFPCFNGKSSSDLELVVTSICRASMSRGFNLLFLLSWNLSQHKLIKPNAVCSHSCLLCYKAFTRPPAN